MNEQHKVQKGFWGKVKETASYVPFICDAIAMYFCMMDERTPMWVKTAVATALLYFIMPVDAIPDVIPFVGYTDDAAVIAGTLATVGQHVTEEHQRKARRALQ